MDYTVELNNFEGPLDLLLHLIKKSEVDIFDISIEDITHQYLEYINIMEVLNLNIASEYLVMATELIEMKSSILLPKRNIDEDDEFEEDPRKNLIDRLLEYEKYKQISEVLKEYENERKNIHTKMPSELNEYLEIDNSVKENFEINDLMNALNVMIKRKRLDQPLNTKIANKEYSVTERSLQIKNIINQKNKVFFTDLFESFSKDYIVVTFLAILNMARFNEIKITQDTNFSEITIENVGE